MQQESQPNNAAAGVQDNVYSGVYHALFIGMMTATVSFTIGVGLALFRTGNVSLTLESTKSYHLGNMVPGMLALDPIAFMLFGTIVTILTPISRVVVSLIAFLVDRDYQFVWITLWVLAAVSASVVLGLSGLAG